MKDLILSMKTGERLVFKDFTNETKVSDVYSKFCVMFETQGIEEKFRFSESTLRRALKDFDVIKGVWDVSIVNQVSASIQEAERRVLDREAERRRKKSMKKAKRNAERAKRNGNRNFLHSQENFVSKHTKQLKPSTVTNIVNGMIFK